MQQRQHHKQEENLPAMRKVTNNEKNGSVRRKIYWE